MSKTIKTSLAIFIAILILLVIGKMFLEKHEISDTISSQERETNKPQPLDVKDEKATSPAIINQPSPSADSPIQEQSPTTSGSNKAVNPSSTQDSSSTQDLTKTARNIDIKPSPPETPNTTTDLESKSQADKPRKNPTLQSPTTPKSEITPPKGKAPHPTTFPGINQPENSLMISAVKITPVDNLDSVTLTITQIGDAKEIQGTVWVVGEYIQRGTSGSMFMASHKEMKLSGEGKPSNTKIGTKFSVTKTTVQTLSIPRPGFEGEELQAIRIGIVNLETGKLHIANVSAKQLAKKSSVKRVKVSPNE